MSEAISTKIMQMLYPYRRELPSLECTHEDRVECYDVHLNKIKQYIQNRQRIMFVLPAFPAKSANTNKTRGPFPDLGERLSLRFLNQLCENITSVYARGAEIIICSDG